MLEAEAVLQFVQQRREVEGAVVGLIVDGDSDGIIGVLQVQTLIGIVGVFRDTVAEKLDVHCAYFQGGAGSTIPQGELKGENSNSSYKKLGAALADVLANAIPSLTPVATGKIETTIAKYAATPIPSKVSSYGKSFNMELCAFTIGDVAFATAPFEMDHRTAKYVKENSPYPMTFMCAYSNGYYLYIPAESSFENGGYEVETCHFVAGTAEGVAATLVDTLTSLRNS